MVRIGNVWDSTTDVLAGRTATLAGVATLAFFVPAAAQVGLTAWGGASPAPGVAALGALVKLVALIASVWGSLTIIAVASDPAITRGQASASATKRLPAALLLMLVLIAVGIALVVPVVAMLAAGGFDFQAAMAQAGSATQPRLPAGTNVFLFFYVLAILIGAAWACARLFPLLAVVLHEKRGIGAFGRSWMLTRGMTWRLIGVGILFVVVFLIASLAAQAVVVVVLRLVLGPALITVATLLGGLAAAVVGAIFSAVVAVFGARLYAALLARDAVPIAAAPIPSAT